MQQAIDGENQKGNEKREDFFSDPLKLGVIILVVHINYSLDVSRHICKLCVLLCLPEKPREVFLAYWTDFKQGLPADVR